VTVNRVWHRYLRFWGSAPGTDVDDELRFHMEMRARDLRSRGLSDLDAESRAQELFGDVAHVRQECTTINRRLAGRSTRGAIMRGFSTDIRLAFRGLWRSPMFTFIAVLTLALGVGANAVIFSLVDAVVLRPMPGVREPGRLFDIATPVSYPAFRDQQSGDTAFAEVAAFRTRRYAVGSGTDASMRNVGLVSGNYFDLLGARAARGRLLGVSDDEVGSATVVSDGYWHAALGGDPSVIGHSIFVNGARFTVVGVTAPQFRGTRIVDVPDLWLPVTAYPEISSNKADIDNRGWSWLEVIGRLRPGATLARAQAVVSATAKGSAEVQPPATTVGSFEVRPSVTVVAGQDAHQSIVQFMIVLSSVAGMVLLIACLNIASLLLARHTRQRTEIAVRVALGATRFRLLRQLLTEALALGTLACIVAVILTVLTVRLLHGATLPGGISLAAIGLHANGTVLGFGIAIALLTTIVVGLVPALHATRNRDGAALQAREAIGSRSTTRLRGILLVAQVAIGVVLLIGAGLFARGLQRALSVDLGFRPERLITVSVNPGLVRYDTARAERYLADGATRMSALPGVTSVAWTTSAPLGLHNAPNIRIEGYAPPNGAQRTQVTLDIVSPGYLTTLGVRLVRGRDFAATDIRSSPLVCMINEAFARRYWPGQDPIGKRVALGGTMTVVGVTANVAAEQIGEDPVPILYQSLTQQPRWILGEMHAVVRASGDPDALLASIRRALRAGGGDVPVYGLRAFDQRLGEVLLPQRIGVGLLGVFSILALLVCGVGVYGVVAYMVSQRTREIGVRIALGAPARSIVELVMGENLVRVAIGIVLGLAVAALTTRVATAFIFGLSAHDGVTYGVMALVMAAVGLLAAYLPARRALKVDPVQALR
jgi:predicted permease